MTTKAIIKMLHFHYNRLNNAERWDEGDGDYDLPNRNSQPSQTNNGIPNIDALQACEQTQSSHHTIEYQQQTQGFATPMVNVDAQSSTMLIHNLEVRARDTSDHLLNGQQGTPLSEQQEDFSIESLLGKELYVLLVAYWQSFSSKVLTSSASTSIK